MRSPVIALLGCFAVGALHAQAPGHFESMDVFELEYAADPQISPDGEHVVYVRTSMDVMADRSLDPPCSAAR